MLISPEIFWQITIPYKSTGNTRGFHIGFAGKRILINPVTIHRRLHEGAGNRVNDAADQISTAPLHLGARPILVALFPRDQSINIEFQVLGRLELQRARKVKPRIVTCLLEVAGATRISRSDKSQLGGIGVVFQKIGIDNVEVLIGFDAINAAIALFERGLHQESRFAVGKNI